MFPPQPNPVPPASPGPAAVAVVVMVIALLGGGSGGGGGAGGPAMAAADDRAGVIERLDDDQQRELEHLLQNVRDEDLALERRRQAAQILLTRGWEAATHALRLDLVRRGEPGTQRAIAQAIAAVDLPDAELMQPLMDLLETDETPLRRDVAAALGRFDDARLLDWLMELAADGGESQEQRLGAIEALAQHRQPEVVELLLTLTDQQEAWAVRATAYDSLARLSGLHALGTDAEAWRQWWSRTRRLDPPQWQASLLQNFSNRNAVLARELEVTTDRLVNAHNRLYDAAAESDRPAMLQEMLDDPKDELRLLALRLIERRVLNAQPVGSEVRQGMRERLTDGTTEVRRKSATVLETLADAEAAALATQLLLGEQSRAVQGAYLALIARVPSEEAVEPALWLLESGRAVAAAADCLSAAFDAGLLSGNQLTRSLAATRTAFEQPDDARRPLLRLLSRIGEEDDLDVLVAHLRHDDEAVRDTAARGFRQEQWPLTPLLDGLDDDALAPVVIEIVERRGQSLATIESLLEHEPDENATANGDLAEAWHDALRAVAARLSADAIADLDERLADLERSVLHERLLQAAAALEEGDAEEAGGDANAAAERRTEAALRLARLHVAREAYDAAARVYEQMDDQSLAMHDEQRDRFARGRIEALLRQGEIEQAASLSEALMEDEALPADGLAAVWIEVAEQAVNGGGDEPAARSLIEAAHTLFERRTGDGLLARLSELREQASDPGSP